MIVLCRRLITLVGLVAASIVLSSAPAHAKQIGIAFIEDGPDSASPRISELIVQELQPLLSRGDEIVPTFYAVDRANPEVMRSLSLAMANREVDFVISTGYIASQQIYSVNRFAKPTYLLRVLDPKLTGIPERNRVRNLRSYSVQNELTGVFARLKSLFNANRVAIVLPIERAGSQRNFGTAVASAASNVGITAQFLELDHSRDLGEQFKGVDAVILPPISASVEHESRLLQTLKRQRIPSYSVGGNRLVLAGALMSDTLEADARVLARRVALDLQLAISGESRTRGFRQLEPRKRTTINLDTARALDVDFAITEILSARVVQGINGDLPLGLLSALQLGLERNLDLRGQNEQFIIDKEQLTQAQASKGPQVAAQLDYARQGKTEPTRSTFGTLSLSQSIFSASNNGAIDVANLGLAASERLLEQKRIDIIQQTASAYFAGLQSQAQLETSLRDLALNRENLVQAQQRKRSGSGAGSEIYRWRAVIAASETTVLRAYTNNTTAQRQLAQVLNTRIDVPTTLADVDLDQPPFDLLHEGLAPYLQSTRMIDLLRRASADRAIEQSPQLKSVEISASINDSRLNTLNRSYYLPEVSVAAQAFRFNINEIPGSQNDWAIGVTAALPLWQSGARSSQRRQLTAQKALANTQVQSLKMALWANSGNAVNDLIANFRAIELSDLAERAARKSQQITQRAYKLGAASITELLDTQNEFRQAQDNANIARYQYLTAMVNFQALMGEMPMLKSGPEQQDWLSDFLATLGKKEKQ
jgi:outer membrane protein TolC